MITTDIRPAVRVDPGDTVVFQGSWDFFCGNASNPLTATVEAFATGGAVDYGWTLPGTIPVPGRPADCDHMAGGGPGLNVVSVGKPGSFSTLTTQLAAPRIYATGHLMNAILTLANRTESAVVVGECPDVVVATTDVNSNGSGRTKSVTLRIPCPSGFTLDTGGSIDINLPFLEAPLSTAGTTTRFPLRGTCHRVKIRDSCRPRPTTGAMPTIRPFL